MSELNAPKILVVDDSSVIRQTLARKLKDLGACVTLASDGAEGFEKACANEFDLVITDIEMPKMDGYSLCVNLKREERTKAIPVIILSSLDTEKDIEKGFRVGASAYVAKADALNELPETIERILEKASFYKARTILVVDDSVTIRSVVKNALEKAGFKVLAAENGLQAMQILNNHRPDLILSDIEMPGMDGIELCRTVHRNPNLATIPYVVMSTKNDRAIMRRMIQYGATTFLTKPFNLEQLVITVERLLSTHFLLLLKEKERLDLERKMMLASITSLIEALEARDPYTRGHSESVADIVVGMAGFMGTGLDELELLKIAGRLHDLGKIGVPDTILLKPGRLTDSEYERIKQHPVAGATIFAPIKTLTDIVPIILYHHERVDGKGYPEGLKGNKIPFWARATAVADTYHALTSDRPYRKGMDHDKALQIIEEVRGTQLCPDCIDLFLKWAETPKSQKTRCCELPAGLAL
ncbi:MAG: response regulator [Proteobacteria bacterium]|nr:response regulator [Pseudomonadota bacterium]MBU4471279.1 response regulator [Pseudomonadota bacterium]MCG2753899.1 response regulator [Desulfobacteraceae bacterium]